MSYTNRFVMIGVPNGWHVGVLDRKRERVLELVADERREKAIIREISLKLFNYGIYEEILPTNSVDDDDTIEQRWNKTLNDYDKLIAEGKYFQYHPGGEVDKDEWNCEVLAEHIMTGVYTARRGKWAALLHKWVGINVATGESGPPRNSGSLWSS